MVPFNWIIAFSILGSIGAIVAAAAYLLSKENTQKTLTFQARA
jgi:hypothetical protein